MMVKPLMHYLMLPFFLALLLPTVSLSMAKITLTRVSFLASSIGCLLFLLYVLSFQVAFPSLPGWKWLVTPPPATAVILPQTNTTTVYEKEFLIWEQLNQLQPTHRDVLVNLAVLSDLLGREADHDQYWNQARQLDPNNAVFK